MASDAHKRILNFSSPKARDFLNTFPSNEFNNFFLYAKVFEAGYLEGKCYSQ